MSTTTLLAGAASVTPDAAPAPARQSGLLAHFDPDRGTGRTTRLMLEAPKGATFVWCGGSTHYAVDLSRHLGRTDLEIMPLHWLRMESVMGRGFPGLVVDHAARPTAWGEVLDAIQYVRSRGIRVVF